MTIPADWKAAAIAITPGFEVRGDPYLGVSGDFDGMGVSCGALQWNIGSGSLQPMVKAVGRAGVVAAMPVHGAQLWKACNGSIKAGLTIVRGWQTDTRLTPRARAELRALMGSPAMKAQQDTRIDTVAETAQRQATVWAEARPDKAVSKRLFCWFFDLVTQNGGLEGLTRDDVADFITLHRPDRADDFVCDYLAGRKGAGGHARDARRNAEAWRDAANGERLELLVASHLRARTALPQSRHVVLNRKGTIAMGRGWVNSSHWDFSGHGL